MRERELFILDELIAAERPQMLAPLFDGLDYDHSERLSALAVARLCPGERSVCSRQMISVFHVLVGPLPDLPPGLTSVEARGVFRSPDPMLVIRDSAGGQEIPPRAKDLEELISAYCGRVDSLGNQLVGLKEQSFDVARARLTLGLWSFSILSLIHPFWDGNRRVGRRQLACWAGRSKATAFSQQALEVKRLLDSYFFPFKAHFKSAACLGWLRGEAYFDRYKELLLEAISQPQIWQEADRVFVGLSLGFDIDLFLNTLDQLESFSI